MTYDPDGQLWYRRMGIRFASSPRSAPLYPRLDISRFLHDSSAAEVENTSSGPQAATEQFHILNNEPVPNALGQDSKERQAKPVEVPSKVDPTTRNDVGKAQGSRNENAARKVAPPITSLSYQIAPELFHYARGRPKGSGDSFWTHTMYRCIGDDGTKTNVKVHYCTSKHTMEYVCRKYFIGEKVLGFDLEWDPWATKEMDARQNVSLIQMASPGHIGLFHCALFSKNDFVAPTFKKIMEDAEVSKAGVNIRADCTRMRNHLGVDTRGIFELSHMYKMVKYIKEGRPNLIDKVAVTLATQVQECLGLPLRKGGDVRLSNWARYLNHQQILCMWNFKSLSARTNALQTLRLMPMLASSFIIFWTRNGRNLTPVLLGRIMLSLASRSQSLKSISPKQRWEMKAQRQTHHQSLQSLNLPPRKSASEKSFEMTV